MTQNKNDESLKKIIGYHLNETDYISGEKLSDSVTRFNDGEYCWTSEEIYHFEKYDLKLNDDVIRYILSK